MVEREADAVTGRSTTLVVTVAVLSAAVCAQPQPPSVAAGADRLRARDYGRCLEILQGPLGNSIDSRDAYIIRGQCAAGRGQYEPAIADYTKALELDSRSLQALYYRGVARSQIGALAEGLDDFSRAIAIDPSFSAAYGGRAGNKRLLDDDAGALGDLSQAIQLQPRNPALRHARGCLFYDRREWDRATDDFVGATELEPQGHALAQARLWLVGSRRGEPNASERLATFLARPGLKLADEWDRSILEFLLGRVSEEAFLRMGEDRAADAFVRAGRLTQAHFYVGSVRLLRGDRTGARDHFQAAVAIGRRSFAEYLSAQRDLDELR